MMQEGALRRSRQIRRYQTLGGSGEMVLEALMLRCLKALSRFPEVQELEERIVVARTAFLGSEHMDPLTAMNNLAATLLVLDVPRAIELHRRVLETRTRKLGPDHEHTLFSIHKLGCI